MTGKENSAIGLASQRGCSGVELSEESHYADGNWVDQRAGVLSRYLFGVLRENT